MAVLFYHNASLLAKLYVCIIFFHTSSHNVSLKVQERLHMDVQVHMYTHMWSQMSKQTEQSSTVVMTNIKVTRKLKCQFSKFYHMINKDKKKKNTGLAT